MMTENAKGLERFNKSIFIKTADCINKDLVPPNLEKTDIDGAFSFLRDWAMVNRIIEVEKGNRGAMVPRSEPT